MKAKKIVKMFNYAKSCKPMKKKMVLAAKRRWEIHKMYRLYRYPMQAIAEAQGISKQRVHQIIKRCESELFGETKVDNKIV